MAVQDLSIPKSRALPYLSRGRTAMMEEIELQESLLDTVAQENLVASTKLTAAQEHLAGIEERSSNAVIELDREKRVIQAEIVEFESRRRSLDRLLSLERHIGLARERVAQLTAAGVGMRQIVQEQKWLRDLEAELHSRDTLLTRQRLADVDGRLDELVSALKAREIARAAVRSDLETARQSVQAIRNKLSSLTNESADRVRRIEVLQSKRDPDSYNHYEHFDVLAREGKTTRRVQHLAPNLSLAMHDAIRRSDVFILIAGMYDQYKQWMEFEFYSAADWGRRSSRCCLLGRRSDHVRCATMSMVSFCRLTHPTLFARLNQRWPHEFGDPNTEHTSVPVALSRRCDRQKSQDRQRLLPGSQDLVVRDRGDSVDGIFDIRHRRGPLCRAYARARRARHVSIAPREDAHIGITAVDHLDDPGQRRVRGCNHVFHREHLIAQLAEHADRRCPLGYEVLGFGFALWHQEALGTSRNTKMGVTRIDLHAPAACPSRRPQ